MNRIGLLLLGRVLGDSVLLGSEPNAVRTALFRPDDGHRVAVLADMAAATVGAQRGSAARRRDVAEFLAAMRDDPVWAISAAIESAENLGDLTPYFPIDLFRGTDGQGETMPLTVDLADAHLHSGASMGIGAFCDLLLASTLELGVEARELIVHDAGWRPVRVGVITAGIRTHLSWRLRNLGYPLTFFKPRCESALRTGEFWEDVRGSATGALDDELWAELRIASPWEGELPVVDIILRGMIDDAGVGGLVERRLSLGMFAALTLLNRYLRSQPSEGLARFVDRFDAMGLARDSLLSDGRAALVAEACKLSVGHPRVVGAEFRKTFVGSSSTVEDRIRRSLADHLEGMAQYAAIADRELRVSMPVGFLRRGLPNGVASNDYRAMVDCEELWKVGRGLAVLRGADETVQRFVGSVDVAGDELLAPAWPFVLLYSALKEMMGEDSMCWTVHAGESFEWTLQGVRNVGEFIMPTRVVDRVGHALSLDADCADQIAGDPPDTYVAREMVDDLCWLIGSGIETTQARDMLERVLAYVGFEATGLSARELLDGWHRRRSLDGLRSAGLISMDPMASSGGPPNGFDQSSIFQNDPALRAMLLLMYLGPGSGALLDMVVEGALSDRYSEWSSEVAHTARAAVVDAIRSNDVVIESCPTSNVRLSGLGSYRHLPLGRWSIQGLQVSLNSDDPLILGRSVADEASVVLDAFGSEILSEMAACSVRMCGRGVAVSSPRDLAEAAARLG